MLKHMRLVVSRLYYSMHHTTPLFKCQPLLYQSNNNNLSTKPSLLDTHLRYTTRLNTICHHLIASSTMSIHTIQIHNIKSRQPYSSYPQRFPVPDDKVDWAIQWPEYKPVEYTDEKAAKHSNDTTDPTEVHDMATRKTYCNNGKLMVDKQTNRPLNPYGRTGMSGRGKLYNWGANMAADPIVTKYDSNKRLCVAVIRRSDNGVWALPGGMLDKGEESIDAAKREFVEEAGNVGDSDKQKFNDLIQQVYHDGYQGDVYSGYVDESRHTDNAWIESVAHHWHVPDSIADQLNLVSGDDATQVKWIPIDGDGVGELHGNHKDFVLRARDLFHQKEKQKQ